MRLRGERSERAASFSTPSLSQAAGYSLAEMRAAGYIMHEALQAGFTPFECREAGFKVEESLEGAGMTPRPPEGERPPWFSPRMHQDDFRFS